MNERYVLAPQAARDFSRILRYIKKGSSKTIADRVKFAFLNKFVYLANFPHGGHWRRDLTHAEVKFIATYS